MDPTRKEFDFLYLLASTPETLVPRSEILAKVWEYEAAGSGRTIDTHASSLRGELGVPGWIIAVRGIGFRLGDGAA